MLPGRASNEDCWHQLLSANSPKQPLSGDGKERKASWPPIPMFEVRDQESYSRLCLRYANPSLERLLLHEAPLLWARHHRASTQCVRRFVCSNTAQPCRRRIEVVWESRQVAVGAGNPHLMHAQATLLRFEGRSTTSN